jgi:hypothetical protein
MSSPVSTPLARGDITISIGPDGRVYFHDLDPELIAVGLALNPADALMRRRLELCGAGVPPAQPLECGGAYPAQAGCAALAQGREAHP